jgi:Family of unknown function (DUF5908)
MAVEIRELVIKAIVTADDREEENDSAPAVAAGSQEIIQECVDQVLKILKQNQNR